MEVDVKDQILQIEHRLTGELAIRVSAPGLSIVSVTSNGMIYLEAVLSIPMHRARYNLDVAGC
jgi:hypothetical protein